MTGALAYALGFIAQAAPPAAEPGFSPGDWANLGIGVAALAAMVTIVKLFVSFVTTTQKAQNDVLTGVQSAVDSMGNAVESGNRLVESNTRAVERLGTMVDHLADKVEDIRKKPSR